MLFKFKMACLSVTISASFSLFYSSKFYILYKYGYTYSKKSFSISPSIFQLLNNSQVSVFTLKNLKFNYGKYHIKICFETEWKLKLKLNAFQQFYSNKTWKFEKFHNF